MEPVSRTDYVVYFRVQIADGSRAHPNLTAIWQLAVFEQAIRTLRGAPIVNQIHGGVFAVVYGARDRDRKP